jgi:hypothetical protein
MKNLYAAILLVFVLLVSANGQIFKTPEEAAQHLYAAWQKKNKSSARQVTHDEAIKKLFGVRRQKMVFKGCAERKEEGDYECLYENKKNDLALAMLLVSTRRGFWIKSLSFSSEAY